MIFVTYFILYSEDLPPLGMQFFPLKSLGHQPDPTRIVHTEQLNIPLPQTDFCL